MIKYLYLFLIVLVYALVKYYLGFEAMVFCALTYLIWQNSRRY